MYLITIHNDGVPTIIHGERHKLANAKITGERNQICSLSFDIYPNNLGYDLLRPLSTTVEVIDTRYGTLEFEGRVVMPVPSMDESGLVMRSVTCEHVEAYLLDSMQAYVEERQWETVGEFISYVLDVHNARMPEEKRVYLGTVDFHTYDTSDGLFCGIQREKTWNTLRSKLTDSFGGEMRVRRGSDGLLYLDYAEKLGTTRATPIKLGRNMKSSRREVNPNEVITRLYPFGAKKTVTETDEYGNETEVETEERLTIASVNDGCEYIEDAVAIEEYG
ncbi:MAG: phage tail protein, partial [Eggerthellaceae bacterium]|nr:phage tail protein [Eggerthellaceae bacterium]